MEAARKGGKKTQKKKAKQERSTGHNPEECNVCMTVFDDTVQRPRTLPCGHTVCTLCVNKLKQQGYVTCPECRISHAVPEGGQFPVSYIVEALLRRLRGAEAAAAVSPPTSAGTGKGAAGAAGQKEWAGLSMKMLSFLQEQEAPVVAAITACQEVQAELDQYQTILTGWGEQQQQLEDRLQGLLDQSRSARVLMRQEESRVAAKKEAARGEERQLHAALEALRSPATDKEARVVMAEVLFYVGEAKRVLQECRRSFPDANTATTVRKVREASNAALEAFQAVQATQENHPPVAEEDIRSQSETDSTIVDKLQAILTPSLKVEDLRSPTEPVRRLLKDGRVFGIHQVEGRRRHARMSLEDGKLYLHTLKEGPLPPGATTLELSQMVPPSPPCEVFLGLSWPGRAPERVHIRLSPDTPRGRQAVLLCMGKRGPSYAGTRLFAVEHEKKDGEYGEYVCGGDYESNDGWGGAALLPDLDEGEYGKSGKMGAVWGWRWLGDPAQGAVFAITTSDTYYIPEYDGVFGEVVHGMDTLVAAAKHKPITEVIIHDCGVVLCCESNGQDHCHGPD